MAGDGLVTVSEAFNWAQLVSIKAQTPTYDDNGDGIYHFGPISNGGVVEDDGRLGATTL